MLRSEYRSRSQEFWKRLEKALTSEMTTAIEEDIALYRRGMAEAAARYARHLNTFRARSKAQLAQKVRRVRQAPRCGGAGLWRGVALAASAVPHLGLCALERPHC